MNGWRRAALPLALAGLLGLGAFTWRGALELGFVYDDGAAIEQNTTLRSWAEALHPPRHTPVAGRPVLNLSFALDRALRGSDPRGFHSTQVMLHLANALLLLLLLQRSLERLARPPGDPLLIAALASAIWLVHPLLTEAVDYATQRSEVLASTFYLATLYAALRAVESSANARRVVWSVLSVVACALGMATKEILVTAPLLVPLHHWSLGRATLGSVLRARAGLYAALAVVGGAVLVALLAAGPRDDTVGTGLGVTPLDYALAQLPVLLRYLRLVVWPDLLALDYGVPRAPALGAALFGFAVILLLLGVVAWALRRERALGVVLLAAFVVLAPTSSVVPIVTEVGAERRMYLPLAALLAGGVGIGAALARRAGPRGPLVATALALAVLIPLSLRTMARHADFADPVRLWTASVHAWPGNPRAHVNLGALLARRGDEATAEIHYRKALEIEPGDPLAHFNLGLVLQRRGDLDGAERAFLTTEARNPEQPHAKAALAGLYAARGELERAAESTEEAARRADALGQDALARQLRVRAERYRASVRRP